MARSPTTSRCSACATTRSTADDDLRAGAETGLGLLRRATCRCCARGGQLVTITPEIRAFLNEPKTLIVTKANVQVARPSPRLHGLYRRQALRRRRHARRRVPHRRPVHLDRLHALGAHHPLSAAQGRRRRAPRRLRSGRPFRQGAGQRAGDLSARRAVPDRRGHALSLRARDPAARRAAARARAGAARPVRPFRLGAGLSCRATATTATCAHAIGDYLAEVYQRPRQRLLSVLPRRAAGARAFHHRPRRRRDAESRPRDAGRGGRRDRPHLDRRARRGARRRRYEPARARALFERYRDAFSDGYREAYSPLEAVDDIRVIEGLSAGAAARRRFLSHGLGRAGLRRPEGLEPRPADPAVRARAGAGEHGLPGRRRAHLSHRAGAGAAGRLVPRHDAGARRRRRASISRRGSSASKRCSSW